MKQLLILIIFTFNIFYSLVVFSQVIKSNDVKVKVNKEERAAISIISEAEIKALQKSWENFLKKNYQAKIKSSNKSVVANAVLIPTISSNFINIYTFFDENKEGSEMIVAAEIETEKFISSKTFPNAYEILKSISQNFVLDFLKTKYIELISDKEKAVNKSAKNEIKMQKEISNLEKNISKDNENILKLQKDIEQCKDAIKKNEALLPELKKVTDAQRADLKELETRKDKLQ